MSLVATSGNPMRLAISTAFSKLQLLDFDIVVHDLDEVAIIEHTMKPTGNVAGFFFDLRRIDSLDHAAAEFAADAARKTNDPLAVFLQDLFVDPRLEIEAFQRGGTGQLDQVAKAGAVLGQQRQVIAGRLAAGRPALVKATARGDVGFVADDRVDPRILRLAIELQRTVQVAVVGQRQRVHAVIDAAIDQFADVAGPVEQAVVAVAMQVGERAWFGFHRGGLVVGRQNHVGHRMVLPWPRAIELRPRFGGVGEGKLTSSGVVDQLEKGSGTHRCKRPGGCFARWVPEGASHDWCRRVLRTICLTPFPARWAHKNQQVNLQPIA